ncbi:Uncharacterized protein OS=Planctomyces brasiliensis (strain ATCC 49424 / DSM 5305 / JCM 21570 / NBRC 103401 / IFAM 1448) GN=Plabr_1608 PE=4 SV=1 [Gemmata massiliana]|uniref:Secreted protein n=1 Tax=Gemmata massiliana TaxID=1210884 RepID=A0A6P2DHR4_9BACT|nr:Uncharacterized protein OS=Planctomyces brasiliensis (strain ATCC 49424 / DSM 5305 / JCM 21570 / NBRC 103401 / IFAM 1448) GN=Plabr_1608 PE=4 SV=1 [Gemmata massiliana]
MRVFRQFRSRSLRHLVAVVALLAQFVAAAGAPVPSNRVRANRGAPFPCQDHPCGCATSEQCWAGDCCCFTLEQKLAWADAREITPPAHVRPMVEERKQADKACCTKTAADPCCSTAGATSNTCHEHAQPQKVAPSVRWVAGMFAQKCHGEGPGGLLKLELVVVPEQNAAPRSAFDPVDSVPHSNSRVTAISLCPPTPPPRLV